MPAAATSITSTSIRRRSIRTSPARAAPLPTTTAVHQFITVKPGAYPWGNHPQCVAAGPHPLLACSGALVSVAAGHPDVFPGRLPVSRPIDPIFNSVIDEKARCCAWSLAFDLENTVPDWALAFKFRHRDSRGREATPLDNDDHHFKGVLPIMS